MSTGRVPDPPPAGQNRVERTRTYRQPIIVKNLYKEVVPAIRPGPGLKGEPLDLKVNWFRVKFPSIPIYIYEVIVDKEQKTKDGYTFVRVTDQYTIATVVYKIIHSKRYVFVNPWRVFFDDLEFLFTPDQLDLTREVGELVTTIKNARNMKVNFRVRISRHANREFQLGLPKPAERNVTPLLFDPLNFQWSTIFIKLMLSQNARFIPTEHHSIHDRFAHFGGGMYYIPQPVDSLVNNKKLLNTDYRRYVQPGIEAWMGFYASCRQMEDGDPVINFGMTNKFFVSLNLNLLEIYIAIITRMGKVEIPLTANTAMKASGVEDFTRTLSGLKVKCNVVPDLNGKELKNGIVERHYRFIRTMESTVCADNYDLEFFDRRSKKKIKVKLDDWYKRQGHPLKYPKLPLCEVKTGKKTDVLPMEVLFTHDKPQKYTKLLDPHARLIIPERLSRSPEQHQRLTTQMVSKDMEYGSDPYLTNMEFSIEKEMVECTGRVFNKHAIIATDDSGLKIPMHPDTGEFKISRPYETTEKEIIFIGCKLIHTMDDEAVKKFCRGIVATCKSKGMNVSETTEFRTVDRRRVDCFIEEGLEYLEKRNRKDNEILVFLFFIEDMDDQLYGEIKLLSDLHRFVVTQVIRRSTIIKLRPATSNDEVSDDKSVLYSIFLKLNAKLGGVNQIVDFSDSDDSEKCEIPDHEHTMFIGIDAIHPSPNSPICSFTIAAKVASTDRNAAKYTDRVMVNPNCNETIQHFEYNFTLLLKEYHSKRGGRYPDRVVILRDGVSDSEMIVAASRELQSIKEAWNRSAHELAAEGYAKPAKPPLYTYIVVQKRHKTRFYRSDVNATNKNANPFPGTVVTEGAVSLHKFDFYMISHYTPKGTSRPAHYTVVVDESNFSTDKITEMCFRLCCVYSRCTKPVSIPTPVYYAHLRCKRVGLANEEKCDE